MLRRLVGGIALALAMAGAGAAEFSLTDTQGHTHTLAAYRGKWVILNLWATWCPPCLAEMPELEALSQARNDVVVLGLAGDGQSPRRLMEFARKLKLTYPIVAGDEKLVQQFGSRVYPTTLIYDPAGNQVLLQEGPVTRQAIEATINRSPTPPKPAP